MISVRRGRDISNTATQAKGFSLYLTEPYNKHSVYIFSRLFVLNVFYVGHPVETLNVRAAV